MNSKTVVERFTGLDGLDAGELADMGDDAFAEIRDLRDAIRAHGRAYGVDVSDAVSALVAAINEAEYTIREIELAEQL
jgi:hypothetical protein